MFQYGRCLLEVIFFLFRLLVVSHFLNGKVKKTESFFKKTDASEKIFASQTIKLCFNINEVPDNQLSAFLIRHRSYLKFVSSNKSKYKKVGVLAIRIV